MAPPLVQQTAVRLEERGYPVVVTEFSHQNRYVIDFRLFVSRDHTESTSTFVFTKSGVLEHMTLRLPPLDISRQSGRQVIGDIIDSVILPYQSFVWLTETDRGLEPHIRCIPTSEDRENLQDAPLNTILRIDRIAANHVEGLTPT